MAEKVSRKKQRRSVPSGQMHIQATFNNTIITFTDKKGTAYAAQVATEKAAENAQALYGLKSVDVFVKGVGLGRDSAIRSLSNVNINVESIKDVTGVPHGGVRPKKARRA